MGQEFVGKQIQPSSVKRTPAVSSPVRIASTVARVGVLALLSKSLMVLVATPAMAANSSRDRLTPTRAARHWLAVSMFYVYLCLFHVDLWARYA